MRVLIDECIDERLCPEFPGHHCQTARYAGLAGLKNGTLLSMTCKSWFRQLGWFSMPFGRAKSYESLKGRPKHFLKACR